MKMDEMVTDVKLISVAVALVAATRFPSGLSYGLEDAAICVDRRNKI